MQSREGIDTPAFGRGMTLRIDRPAFGRDESPAFGGGMAETKDGDDDEQTLTARTGRVAAARASDRDSQKAVRERGRGVRTGLRRVAREMTCDRQQATRARAKRCGVYGNGSALLPV